MTHQELLENVGRMMIEIEKGNITVNGLQDRITGALGFLLSLKIDADHALNEEWSTSIIGNEIEKAMNILLGQEADHE